MKRKIFKLIRNGTIWHRGRRIGCWNKIQYSSVFLFIIINLTLLQEETKLLTIRDIFLFYISYCTIGESNSQFFIDHQVFSWFHTFGQSTKIPNTTVEHSNHHYLFLWSEKNSDLKTFSSTKSRDYFNYLVGNNGIV